MLSLRKLKIAIPSSFWLKRALEECKGNHKFLRVLNPWDYLNIHGERPASIDGMNLNVRSSLLILYNHNFFDLYDIWFLA